MEFADNVKLQRACQVAVLFLIFIGLLASTCSLLNSVFLLIPICSYGYTQRIEGKWERDRENKNRQWMLLS